VPASTTSWTVGGGTGARLIALLRAYSSLHGTLVELPGPAERAAGRFAEVGLSTPIIVVARSFFDPGRVAGGGLDGGHIRAVHALLGLAALGAALLDAHLWRRTRC
jgi:hypothetical protein